MTGPATPAGPRRPPTVTAASVLLMVMGVAGLGYAATALAVTPSTLDAFRAAAAGSGATAEDVDELAAWVWFSAGAGAIVAVLLCALLVGLGLGLRKGRSGARTTTFVVAALGLLCGGCAALTTTMQRAIPFDLPGTGMGNALAESYPPGWIWLNVGLAGGQILGYVVVTVLLMVAPGAWFRSGPGRPAPTGPGPVPPGLAPPGSAQSGFGPPGPVPPTPLAPGVGHPTPGASLFPPLPPGPHNSAPAEPPPPHDDRWAPPSG